MDKHTESRIFNVLKYTVILLIIFLIIINIIYITSAYSTRHCLMVNVSTIILLIWTAAFWLVVSKYLAQHKD